MSEEVNSAILSLLEKEIPEGRQALRDGHENLAKVAAYCEQKYIETNNRYKSGADRGKAQEETRAVLEETKQFTTQSLASVAYQINSLALNMLGLLNQQAFKLQDMESTVNHISQAVDIHKEKVARKGIGTLASSKPAGCGPKIMAPPEQEKAASYSSRAIDCSALDHLGHGVTTPRQQVAENRGTLKQKMRGRGASKRRPPSNAAVPPPIVPSVPYLEQGLPPPPSIPFPPEAPFLPPDDDVIVPPPPPLLGDSSVPLATGIPSPPLLPSIGGAVPAPPPPPGMPSPPIPSSVGGTVPAPPPLPGIPSPPSPPSIGGTVPAPPPPPGIPSPPPPPSIGGTVPVPPPPSGIPSSAPPPSVGGAVPAPPPLPGIPSPPPPPGITGAVPTPPAPPGIPSPPPPPSVGGAVSEQCPDPMNALPIQPKEGLSLTPKNYIEKVVTLYEYEQQMDDELTFQEGVTIYVIKKNDDGWYEGVTEGGKTGLFPENYVAVCL